MKKRMYPYGRENESIEVDKSEEKCPACAWSAQCPTGSIVFLVFPDGWKDWAPGTIRAVQNTLVFSRPYTQCVSVSEEKVNQLLQEVCKGKHPDWEPFRKEA